MCEWVDQRRGGQVAEPKYRLEGHRWAGVDDVAVGVEYLPADHRRDGVQALPCLTDLAGAAVGGVTAAGAVTCAAASTFAAVRISIGGSSATGVAIPAEHNRAPSPSPTIRVPPMGGQGWPSPRLPDICWHMRIFTGVLLG